jgi:hypothetical protein
MLQIGRTCYFEGRPLPPGLTAAEHEIAAAVGDMLARFYAVGEGALPLETLPS